MEKQPFEDVSPIKQLDNGPCPPQESKVWRYQEAWKTSPRYTVWDLFLLNLLKSQPLSNSEVLKKARRNTTVLYCFLSRKKKEQSPLRPVRIILGENPSKSLATSQSHHSPDFVIWAAAFICFVAPVKKIYGVPPPRFNLESQDLALFHHDWSRFPIFDINMFINVIHIKTYLVFGVPPSRLDLVLQVKPTFHQTLLDATSSFHQSK